MKLIIAALLLFTSQVHAVDGWQLAGNAFLALDYIQTQEIARNPRFTEGNLLLGKDPTKSEVNVYFGTVFLLYNGINYFMDDGKLKSVFNKAFTAVEGSVVIYNAYKGVKLKVRF